MKRLDEKDFARGQRNSRVKWKLHVQEVANMCTSEVAHSVRCVYILLYKLLAKCDERF